MKQIAKQTSRMLTRTNTPLEKYPITPDAWSVLFICFCLLNLPSRPAHPPLSTLFVHRAFYVLSLFHICDGCIPCSKWQQLTVLLSVLIGTCYSLPPLRLKVSIVRGNTVDPGEWENKIDYCCCRLFARSPPIQL